MSPLLLDTNILIHGARRNAVWNKIVATCNPMLLDPSPIVHIVSHGEILSFAEQRLWGDDKRQQLSFLLQYFSLAQIGSAEVDAYALLDSYSKQLGIKMGKNDLWIAASAHTTGATLVTTDTDFDHLAGKFFQRIWIDPTL